MMSGVLAPIVLAGEAVSVADGIGGRAAAAARSARSSPSPTAASPRRSRVEIVDFVSKSDIDAATAKIAKAEKDIDAAQGHASAGDAVGCGEGLRGVAHRHQEGVGGVENKSKLRRGRADVVRQRGGGGQWRRPEEAGRARLRGIVQAMPVVERVIACRPTTSRRRSRSPRTATTPAGA